MSNSRPSPKKGEEIKNPHNDKYGLCKFSMNLSAEIVKRNQEEDKVFIGKENAFANNSHLG